MLLTDFRQLLVALPDWIQTCREIVLAIETLKCELNVVVRPPFRYLFN